MTDHPIGLADQRNDPTAGRRMHRPAVVTQCLDHRTASVETACSQWIGKARIMSHPLEHMMSPQALRRAKNLAEQFRREELFRAYVARNVWWISLVFVAGLAVCLVAAAMVMSTLFLVFVLVNGEQGVVSMSIVRNTQGVTGLLAFTGLFYVFTAKVLAWLHCRALRFSAHGH